MHIILTPSNSAPTFWFSCFIALSQHSGKNVGDTKHRQRPTLLCQQHFATQHNVHHDHVDEECDLLKIKYRKWEGSTNEKTELHVSHVPFESESKIPHTQEVPSNCVLCPVKKYLKDNWDRDRHYNVVHISHLIVIEDVVALQCNCSAVHSRGWQKDKAR